mmetsp:Transcript_1754/g.2416  ORF Transcript_1754/g.2416 Transcript_1754/m.2416 type:complete len:296 (+) Transcript_1754:172-1059(+)|eukprot:CAMPEP_0178899054 /NCGR_PEP_ID=MMETSP0786-20121207/2679_1 /TAXON_ID=186022 /ORGANISM="Thalassionema frauenfeldii, Strain CCMP 1798" /LENGTH=295 /DNA_ID=CAMNT_0020569853 /DNA_START=234 /DNA_END=1121 /DNA_ORIENTATION=+
MGPDEDLPTLIKQNDHLSVMRFLRAQEIRDPDTTLRHGKALLGEDLSKRSVGDESARLACLEQVCLAALDIQDHTLAEKCLSQLRLVTGKEAIRFRMLLARCLEAAGEGEEALAIYDDVLKTHPANLLAMKRKYCLAEEPQERMELLNQYLEQNSSDAAAWYEMCQLRKELGDFRGAAYCMEEVILSSPMDAPAHVELAECFASCGEYRLARKHMAQALELDATNTRAMFGLVMASNGFLESVRNLGKKHAVDEHDVEVAKELVKYGADKLLKTYKGTKMYATVQKALSTYTDNL